MTTMTDRPLNGTEPPPNITPAAAVLRDLAGITKRDAVRYACEQLRPRPTTAAVGDWLTEHGVTVGRTTLSTEVNAWRRENNVEDTGPLPTLTPDRLADLDRQHDHPVPLAEIAEDAELATLARPLPLPPTPVVLAPPPAADDDAPPPSVVPARVADLGRLAADHVRGRGPVAMLTIFYGLVASLALWGQSDGMLHWLSGLTESIPVVPPRLVAIVAGLAVEFVAAVLLAFADWRTIHRDERAFGPRTLAIGIAGFVVWSNWTGHEGGARILFAGLSAVGFLVWVLHSAARRRDALRERGRLAAVPPSYPLLMWLRHPTLTWQAREAAKRDPELGLYGSVEHVRTEQATAARRDDLGKLVTQWLSRRYAGDKLRVAIESRRYDLDQIARSLADGADHAAMTAAIASELTAAPPVPDSDPEQN